MCFVAHLVIASIFNLPYTGNMDKKRILIAEDEEAMQEAIKQVLERHGFSVLIANNGEEGLEIGFREHPDLILVDILMPKMDGMIMFQRLRQDDWGKTVPVIILTNVSPNTDSMINSILKNNPAYYLIKSEVKLDGIVDKVKEVLRIEE